MIKNYKKRVLAYLAQNKLMTLGTSLKNKPWGATVFFAYDKNLNILFYSRDDTRHCQHIKRNPLVSVVINQVWKGKGGFIKGLQMTGSAAKVPEKQLRSYYALYRSRFKWADEFSSDHALYIIKLLEVWLIDQKFFGHFFRVRINPHTFSRGIGSRGKD